MTRTTSKYTGLRLNKTLVRQAWATLLAEPERTARALIIAYQTEDMAVQIQKMAFDLDEQLSWDARKRTLLDFDKYLGVGREWQQGTTKRYIFLYRDTDLTYLTEPDLYKYFDSEEIPPGYTYIKNAWRRKND